MSLRRCWHILIVASVAFLPIRSVKAAEYQEDYTYTGGNEYLEYSTPPLVAPIIAVTTLGAVLIIAVALSNGHSGHAD